LDLLDVLRFVLWAKLFASSFFVGGNDGWMFVLFFARIAFGDLLFTEEK